MVRNLALVGALLLSVTAVACSAEPEGEDLGGTESAVSSGLRNVDVIVSAKKTGESYEARAYPIDDVNDDGLIEYYKAPVYYVYVEGTDASGNHVRREWKAPRFMPYNNPAGARHDDEYKTNGFVTAGLSNVPRFAVGTYKPDYEVHNRFSPFGGAIVVKGGFYIHAGPDNLQDAGWGSAGCVEILGNFDGFKKDILELAGSPAANGKAAELNAAMVQLVSSHKLFVTYQAAARPNIKASFSRQVSEDDIGDHTLASDDPAAIDVPDAPVADEPVVPVDTSTSAGHPNSNTSDSDPNP